MKTIVNMTTHDIVIIPESVTERGRRCVLIPEEGFVPIVLPKTKPISVVFRAEERQVPTDAGLVPIITKKLLMIDPIPAIPDYVVVSALYAHHARRGKVEGWERLLTVDSPVFPDEEARKPCGCLGLAE